MVVGDGRAYGPLTHEHLNRLIEIARRDREGLFQRCPHLEIFRDRILTVALCQGGALHYVDNRNGVKDLDVWTLYAAHPTVTYPPRRRGEIKFGPSELTGWSESVDLLGRSVPYPVGHDPVTTWRDYLTKSWTTSARFLSQKPVVLLEPAELRGKVVWPRA